jgi:O-glycosyl hydrolase
MKDKRSRCPAAAGRCAIARRFLFAAAAFAVFQAGAAMAQTGTAAAIRIDPAQRFQVIDGFGVNFNGTYFRDSQRPMLDMMIDDLGATMFRLDPYGLINWEAANDNDDPKVMNWEYYNDRYSIPAFEASWAAARYLNSRGIRPILALSGIAPDWMLDRKAEPPKHWVCRSSGGAAQPESAKPSHLNPAMYEEFAETVVSLAMYARNKARIDYEYFGPLNETDCYPAEGPRIDPDEMPVVLTAIARRMKKEGLGDVRLVVAEQAGIQNDYIDPMLQAPELMRQVGAFAVHTYGSDSVGPQVERVRNSKHPSIPVWLTEYGDLNDLDRSSQNEWDNFSIKASQRALRALNQGATATLFWDAYDNYHEHYPRLTFYGLVQNADHIYAPKKRYFAAKQLYKFVRPGAQRIGAVTDSQRLMVSAFRDSNSIVVVGVKEGGPNTIQVTLPTMDNAPSSWELYQTTRALDCRKTESVAVRNGAVQLELPDQAIFTLVGSLARESGK